MMNKIITFTVLCLLTANFSLTAFPQENSIVPLEVGDIVPNLTFNKITNTKESKIVLEENRDKILILDFWASWCSPCIASMPHLVNLQEKFKDKIKVILVNYEDKSVVDAFFKNREKLIGKPISLPSLYNSAYLKAYFPHKFIPHTVIIDRNGKIIATTIPEEINADVIERVYNNQTVSIYRKYDGNVVDQSVPFYNELSNEPILVRDGVYGKDNLKFRSVLTKAIEGEISQIAPYFGRMLVSSSSILGLIKAAYSYSFNYFYDNVSNNRIIIDVKNIEKIAFPKGVTQQIREDWAKVNTYTYDLVFPEVYKDMEFHPGPDSIRRYACEVMKKDIRDFSGINTYIEEREIECLVIKATDTTLINSKMDFGRSEDFPGKAGAIYRSKRFRLLFENLRLSLQHEQPLIDDTGYSGPINVKIEADMTNWKEVSKALENFGLYISRENRKIKMLIIKD